MKIDILTLFPDMFQGPLTESMIKRAQEKKLVTIKIHDLRKWALDKHKTADDRPFGGGKGMILKIEPVYRALKELKKSKTTVIFLTPQGKVFSQKKAQTLTKKKHLIFICGHYEGVDERIRQHLVDEEISIGDYVLTGGELPAMIVVDTLTRLIPGVLEKEARQNESFQKARLDYPQYTRPADFKDWSVPEILLSGDHRKITEWRQKQSLKRTKKRRPDLLSPAKS